MNNYRDLKVWQSAVNLVVEVYRAIESMPITERFALADQIRRSSVSVASNIAEGAGRNSQREFHYFLSIASGSASELSTQIEIAEKLNYISREVSEPLIESIAEVHKMIYGLQAAVRRNIKPKPPRSKN